MEITIEAKTHDEARTAAKIIADSISNSGRLLMRARSIRDPINSAGSKIILEFAEPEE